MFSQASGTGRGNYCPVRDRWVTNRVDGAARAIMLAYVVKTKMEPVSQMDEEFVGMLEAPASMDDDDGLTTQDWEPTRVRKAS